jgi:hypothetical protein
VSAESEAVLPLFRKLAKEFASTADGDVEDLIDVCAGWLSFAVFRARTSEAIARLVAHELTLSARRAAASAGSAGVGPVTSQSAGDLSVTYGALSSISSTHEDDYYRQTHHGLAYLQIRDSRAETGFGLLT